MTSEPPSDTNIKGAEAPMPPPPGSPPRFPSDVVQKVVDVDNKENQLPAPMEKPNLPTIKPAVPSQASSQLGCEKKEDAKGKGK